MKQKSSLSVVLIAMFLLLACAKKTPQTQLPLDAFSDYINGVTSGNVARNEAIVIKFTRQVIKPSQINDPIAKGLLTFSPSIKGKGRWVNESTIEFVPTSILNWNTTYLGTLKLSSIMDTRKELNEFQFSFTTPSKNFTVHIDGVSLGADKNRKLYELKGKITTTDLFEKEDVEKIISATQENTDLKIEWTHGTVSNQHQFVVKGIVRSEKRSEVKLKWSGSEIDVDQSDSKLFEIPSLSDFKILSINVVNNPDQYIVVGFSEAINSTNDLRGMVSIDNASVKQLLVSENQMKVYPEKRLFGPHVIEINRSIESELGYKLESNYSEKINFGGLKPEVQMIGQGVIMPQNKGLNFPFMAVSLQAVDVRIKKIFANNIHQFLQSHDLTSTYNLQQVGRVIKSVKIDLSSNKTIDLMKWNNFTVDLTKLIEVEKGAIYNVEIGFRKEYSLYDCENNDDQNSEFVPIEDEEKDPESDYHNVYYNFYNDWDENNDPCSHSYFSPNRFVNRNIFGSDFGIICKCDKNNKAYIAVTNLLTAKPESGVKIAIFDYQNQLLSETQTNSDGLASADLERAPFMVVAKESDRVGYLRTLNGNSLSMSQFDVSGEEVKAGIKGFIYGERGVWRPGDSVFVSFILEDQMNRLPDGHPIVMEVRNPRGQFVKKITRIKNEAFIYPFFFATQPDDPTGNWTVLVKVGGSQFSNSIRIETVKPNRLKVELTFNSEVLQADKTYQAKISSKWLHGAPANNLRAKVDVSFSPFTPSFKKFDAFDFSTPYELFNTPDITMFDAKLDGNGMATTPFSFTPNSSVSGFLKATFTSRVFENGGDFSINRFSKTFSPYSNYVGLNIDWSYKNWKKLDTDKENTIEVASVSPEGSPVSVSNVDVVLYKLESRWWYDNNNENLATYSSKTYHNPYLKKKVSTLNGKGKFSVNVPEGEWGRYLLLVTSPSGHTCGQVIYFDWPWGSSSKKSGGAQMLTLMTNKEKCNVGDDVTISFPSNNEARALITFESGSKVLGQYWIENLGTLAKYTFKAKPEMAPNVYVHVTLIQPHAQTANDLPIRLYGVIPILVEDPDTRLKPKIEMPEKVRPLKEFAIRISEERGKSMDYTLSIVDEGLLDLTNFVTPDPWTKFYAREALGVRTWDMYDYVMGAFGARLEQLFAVGGDGINKDKGKNKAERFKPVVKVLGPFRLERNETATHKITLPQYVGSVRVMAVAANTNAYGNAEKTVPVRDPLMILATLPRVLSPQEKVLLPVTVFAMEPTIKNATVTIETNDLIQIEGANKQQLSFSAIGEKDIQFTIKAANRTGIAKVKVMVESGSEKSFHEIELDVRLPNPQTIQSEFKAIAPGQKWSTQIEKFGIEGSSNASVEVSSMPPLNLGSRLNYLIHYPYGCIEQTTSSVFPQLYLPRLMELSKEKEDEIIKNINAGFDRLQKFQLGNGGFSYWPGGNEATLWGSNYATHFLIEAEKAGYTVPSNLKKNAIKYLQQAASDYQVLSKYGFSSFDQAYRLYVLALAGEPQVAAMNRLRSTKEQSFQTHWMLAAAYSLSGMKEVAYELVDFRLMTPDKTFEESYGSITRDRSIVLQTLNHLGEREQAVKLALELSKELSQDQWMSTQTTAWTLVAIAEFAGKDALKGNTNYIIGINDKSQKVEGESKVNTLKIDFAANGTASISIENKSNKVLYVNINNIGILAGADTRSEARGLQLSVAYYNRDGVAISPDALNQGDDLIAKVTVKNTTALRVRNIALNQMFPSGWEIINTRLFEGAATETNSEFDYRDIRDDRVYTFFTLSSYESKTFMVNLNASYAGEYILPSVTCEAMYDNAYFAKVPGKMVKVVKK